MNFSRNSGARFLRECGARFVRELPSSANSAAKNLSLICHAAIVLEFLYFPTWNGTLDIISSISVSPGDPAFRTILVVRLFLLAHPSDKYQPMNSANISGSHSRLPHNTG